MFYSVVFLLLPRYAFCGPTGDVDQHAAVATGFAGAYLESIRLSAEDDPRYATRLLDGLDLHLRSVTAMTSAAPVTDYLEGCVMGTLGVGLEAADRLSERLGKEPLDPLKASALLLADALLRPNQFREVREGLETIAPGLGKHASLLLRNARGTGDKRIVKVLHAVGAPRAKGRVESYTMRGRFARVFDGTRVPGESPSAGDSRPGEPPSQADFSIRLD